MKVGTQSCGSDLHYGACACPMGKRVFVTSGRYPGNLMATGGASDGLLGGDKLCQQSAQAANLGGTWKAWLSAPGTDARSRIADVGPWYLVDGTTRVFNNLANLSTTALAPIIRTEQNAVASGETAVWTGTTTGGAASQTHCTSWTMTASSMGLLTGTVGDAGSAGEWTQRTQGGNTTLLCSTTARLYCFEQ